jgi:hypothetical protein
LIISLPCSGRVEGDSVPRAVSRDGGAVCISASLFGGGISIEGETRQAHAEIKIIQIGGNGSVTLLPEDWDLKWLDSSPKGEGAPGSECAELPWEMWRGTYESTIGALLTQTRIKVDNPLAARVKLLGISVLPN